MSIHAQANRIKTLVLFLLVSGIYGHGVLLQQRRGGEQNKPYGLYTPDAILARAQHDSDMLSTLPAHCELSANRNNIYHDDRKMRIWEVECHDEIGVLRARFTWDADTGELLYAGTNMRKVDLSAPSIDCRMAVGCARRWLECLDCGLGKEWKLIGAPEPYSQTISMLLLRGRQRMFVQVNARDGSLDSVRKIRDLDGEPDGRRESSVPEMQN